MISTVEKMILYLGQTFTGRNHDYSMLKEEFPPEQDWFVDLDVLVDLAYLGMPKAYRGKHVQLPHKKPRKSKKNPETHLSDEQKAENRALSQIRVFVENAIGRVSQNSSYSPPNAHIGDFLPFNYHLGGFFSCGRGFSAPSFPCLPSFLPLCG